MNEGLNATHLGLSGIPREAEIIPLERDLRMAALTGGKYHAAKISTSDSAEAIERYKSMGQWFRPEFRSIICRSMKTILADTAHFSACRRLCVLRKTVQAMIAALARRHH